MSFEVENHSPFPHFAFVKTGPDGSDFRVVAMRGTYDWVDGGEATVAADQAPVLVADRRSVEPDRGELLLETDLVVGKPRADIHVIGRAHAPSGDPLPEWIAGIRVGSLSKAVRVLGPRRWEKGAFGWRLTPSRPAASVPLTYRLAYGGTRRRVTHRGEEKDTFAQNPIGAGYEGRFPIDEPIWPAPQIEAPDAPIRSLSDRPRPEGFGPIARWWTPRRTRAGSLTEAFVRENPGKLPDDFDWGYYNSAHPDLQYPGFLQGDEEIAAVGLFPGGQSTTRLPGYRAVAVLALGNGVPFAAAPKLDTLTVDTDARRIHATWRLTVPERMGPRAVRLGFVVPPRPGPALFPLRARA